MITRRLALTALFGAALNPPAIAEEKPQPFDVDNLYGAWLYVDAYTTHPDGNVTEEFGSKPQGIFIIMPNGWYSHIVMNGDLRPFNSGLLKKPTPEEAADMIKSSLAHFGTFNFNSKEGHFTVHILKSSFPNFDGIDQRRDILELTEDRLRYVNYVSSAGGGAKVYATLRRIK